MGCKLRRELWIKHLSKGLKPVPMIPALGIWVKMIVLCFWAAWVTWQDPVLKQSKSHQPDPESHPIVSAQAPLLWDSNCVILFTHLYSSRVAQCLNPLEGKQRCELKGSYEIFQKHCGYQVISLSSDCVLPWWYHSAHIWCRAPLWPVMASVCHWGCWAVWAESIAFLARRSGVTCCFLLSKNRLLACYLPLGVVRDGAKFRTSLEGHGAPKSMDCDGF